VKGSKERWVVIFIIFLATTINYIDRQALSVAAPFIKDDLSLSNEQYGWIVSAFLLAYAIMQFVSGNLIDKIGVKKGFSIAVVFWSLASIGHGLVKGFMSLVEMRFLLGIGEAANYPTAMKAISEWFPKEERTKATGIYDSASINGFFDSLFWMENGICHNRIVWFFLVSLMAL